LNIATTQTRTGDKKKCTQLTLRNTCIAQKFVLRKNSYSCIFNTPGRIDEYRHFWSLIVLVIVIKDTLGLIVQNTDRIALSFAIWGSFVEFQQHLSFVKLPFNI
jgi:hypothetical protein